MTSLINIYIFEPLDPFTFQFRNLSDTSQTLSIYLPIFLI